MNKKYYLHRNNIITGPFDRTALLSMLKSGVISLQDTLSLDKIRTSSICEALDIAVPEAAAAPPPAVPQAPSEDKKESAQEPETDTKETPAAVLRPAPVIKAVPTPKQNSLLLNFSDTVGALFNADSCQQKLLRAGSEVMTNSAFFAIFTALLVSALAVIFYGRHYTIPFRIILARGMLWTVSAGIFCFLYCRMIKAAARANEKNPPEVDFMLSTHCMMYASMVLLSGNAVMFLFNRQLFAVTGVQLVIALAVVLLAKIFFLSNFFLTLRLSFMHNKALNQDAAAAWASLGIWLAMVIFFFFQYAVYKI